MRQSSKPEFHLRFFVCFLLQIVVWIGLLIVLLIDIYENGRFLLFPALVLSSASLTCSWVWFLRPITKIERKLKKIHNDMPDDPFWQEIATCDSIEQVLQQIDALFDRVKNQSNKDYQAELLNRQAEFFALQSQINPHFLYNTLDSIRGQAMLDGVDEIAEMTEALSTFFRYSISQRGAMVTLAEEIKNVENYFFIQQFRFSNRFQYSIRIEDPLALTFYLPKLTIQPIVENSIFHGLESKVGEGHINIWVTMTARRLIIDISDNGIGMDKATLEELRGRLEHGMQSESNPEKRRTGIAMSNVNQRIRLFFGQSYGVTISSTLRMGTNVQVVIPLVSDPSMKDGDPI